MRNIASGTFLGLTVAFALFVSPARADQTDPRLDGLFARLHETEAAMEAEAVTEAIWAIWSDHRDARARDLLALARAAMARYDHEEALTRLDLLTRIEPDFAEAWNARATLYFILGAYDSSIADIRRTLALEPRHFGAISGLGQILAAQGRVAAAIAAFERALEINPYLDGPRMNLERLRKTPEGKRI